MAFCLATDGYRPVLVARNQDRLMQTTAEIEQAGYNCIGFCGDVTQIEDLESIKKQLVIEKINLDFVIVNAGVVTPGALADFNDPLLFKRDLDTNLWGAMLTVYTFLPLLKSGGKLLFISSGFGLMGAAGYGAYCASKAGVINFAESLRREVLFSKNISVYVACPGDIDTPQYHRETRDMPHWMKIANARGKAEPTQVAAMKILKKCKGRRLLILPNFEVQLLHLANRFLPQSVNALLLDRMFPRP